MSERNLNVVVICPGCGGSGAVANVALHQSAELAKYCRVQLVSDGLPHRPAPGVVQRLIRPPIFRQLRRFAHVPREAAFALWAKAAVRRLHAEQRVDAVICHGHPVAALAGAPLTRGFGIPYILVTHGDIFDRPRGTYDPLLTRFYRRVTRPAYRRAACIVALSPHMEELATRGGAQPERVVVIPNGIDPAEIGLNDRQDWVRQPHGDRLELLYVGRLSVEKGVDVLLGAAEILRDRGVNFRLRIVGGGPERARLSARIAQARLEPLVTLLGTVERRALGPLYRCADLVCVPSRSDTLPTVVLEAMAAGAVVVGTDVGGIPYMVEHGVTGVVCAADGALALADALQDSAAQTDAIKRMRQAARHKAVNDFSWASVGRALHHTIMARIDTLPPVGTGPSTDGRRP